MEEFKGSILIEQTYWSWSNDTTSSKMKFFLEHNNRRVPDSLESFSYKNQ